MLGLGQLQKAVLVLVMGTVIAWPIEVTTGPTHGP